ncbi:hypothetical protein NHG29_08200 [Aerococcaceae bacterium NML160702]|nr:hypothetical protein [Aerococcaceae bacterium NML160702]
MEHTKMKCTFFKAYQNAIYMLSAYFGKLDVVLLSVAFGYMMYSVGILEIIELYGNSIIFLAILYTLVAYIIGKTVVWLISILPIPTFNQQRYNTVIFVPNKEDGAIEITRKSFGLKDRTLVCQYDSIRYIIFFPGGRGYFTYIKNGKISTLVSFYTFSKDFFEVPIEEWVDMVKKYNPNVKIKAYKHRFWMF